MTKDETLRMALEALDALCINDYSGYELGKRDAHLVDNALTVIKEALAQPAPVQEPNHGDELTIAYMSGLHKGKELAPQQRTWVGTVDCIGLALDLEAQAKRVESQTVQRTMLAAANGLRIIDKESKT